MRRVSEFDALRGMAALGVLLFHLRPLEGWTHFGMTGVHLFLVLSGFLITNIVIHHVGAPKFFRAFYARRILRIWPIYYLTLFFLIAFQILSRMPDPRSLRALPYYLTFTQYTWHWPGLRQFLTVPPEFVHAFEHSWTLALEEQFYLLWPLAIALVGPRRVVPMVLGICGFSLWFKTREYDSWILFNNFGAFAMGGLIAAMLDDKARVDRNRPALSIFFLTASVAALGYLRWYYKVPVSDWPRSWLLWRDSVQNFAFYTVHFGIVGFVATNAGRLFLGPLRLKELTHLGEISYGLYLYHLPVFWLIDTYGGSPSDHWSMWVAKIALTFVVATLSYRYIEKPILSLKDRFPYGEKAAVGPPTPPPAVRQPRMIYTRAPRPEGERVAPGR